MNLKLNQKAGVKGHFDIYLTRGDTGKQELVSSFDNLILDQGMDWISNNIAPLHYCHVGTGNSTPIVSQTQLDTKVATQEVNSAKTQIPTPVSPNYESKIVLTYAFAQGAVVGNISEVGVGINTTQLFCRALTVDGSGNPTTITVTAIDYLTVVYTLTVFPQLTDTTETVVINGVSTTVTTRALSVTSNALTVGYWSIGNGGFYSSDGISSSAHNNSLRAVTADLGSGQISRASSESVGSYVAGSFKAKRICVFGNSRGNGAISRFELSSSLAFLQFGVSPAIVKDNTMTLTVTLYITWARA